MSAIRPLRCLRAPLSNARIRCATRRSFHATAAAQQSGPPQKDKKNSNPLTAPYTMQQLKELQQLYTPEQLSALLAGESAIDRADFEKKRPRDGWDMFQMPYLDDFTDYHPVLDFPPPDQSGQTFIEAVDQPLPRLYDPALTFTSGEEEGQVNYDNLSKLLGVPAQDIKKLYAKKLVQHSVTNQTRLGKIRSIYTCVVAGNGNGLMGVGEGKANEFEDSQTLALANAYRNMKPIPRYERRTIFGNMAVKIGAVEMELFARPPGFGVRCSEKIFEMCRAAGIHDLSVRVTRSRNPMNVIKTFEYALHKQKLPETIARGRGLKMVDVRKVYYSGKGMS